MLCVRDWRVCLNEWHYLLRYETCQTGRICLSSSSGGDAVVDEWLFLIGVQELVKAKKKNNKRHSKVRTARHVVVVMKYHGERCGALKIIDGASKAGESGRSLVKDQVYTVS